MNIHKTLPDTPIYGNTVVALGCFDGVHRGHAEVILKARQMAEKLRLPLTVFTFREPPKNFFLPHSVPLLTDEEEKARQIAALGADHLYSVPFDGTVANLSAEQFFEELLIGKLSAVALSCGFNYNFGKGGLGNTDLLSHLCEERGLSLSVASPVLEKGVAVSSSRIRESILGGDMRTVRAMLGRPYAIRGEVINGQHLARDLGFPTVNQPLSEGMAIPRYGVYLSRIREMEDRFGITNVGMRPTVKGTLLCAETHIFDFTGDLYGKHLSVELLDFLRPETPFPTIEALRLQVERDIARAKDEIKELT